MGYCLRLKALKQVKASRGSPGVDGMSVKELDAHLKTHWDALRTALLCGTYQPQREFNLALHALLNCLRPVLRLADIPSRWSRSSYRLRDPPRKRKMQMTVSVLLS
jgi:hypothetical protein